jgi:hypothetical protein
MPPQSEADVLRIKPDRYETDRGLEKWKIFNPGVQISMHFRCGAEVIKRSYKTSREKFVAGHGACRLVLLPLFSLSLKARQRTLVALLAPWPCAGHT